MNKLSHYKNWRLETDPDRILWLYLDKEKASVNTLNQEIIEEFSTIIDSLAQNTEYVGVVIASAKPTGFIAGADISQFTQFKDIDQATAILRMGQAVFQKLASLKLRTVALIDGFCLGGGLELALACSYRIAEDGPKTRLGFPEVKLGIIPGWGGSVRMPRLIGALQGLNLVLSGHTVSGKAAMRLGFVDAAVPKRQLVHAAKYYLLKQPPLHKPSSLQAFANQKIARQVIGYYMRKTLTKKISPMHYPAPFSALDNWEHIGVDNEAAFEREARTCGKLFFSETSQNLVRVFFLQEHLKGLAKNISFSPKHIHVIGAGTMGGDIAAWCALRGYTVTLQDLEPSYLSGAIKRAYTLFKDKLKEFNLVQKAMDNLIPDVEGKGLSKADIIIEAVVEDLNIKQAIFKAMEEKAKPNAIFATNTSSIPLDEINSTLKSPERLVGIHFFNPVAKMQLVEVVKGKHTSQEVVDKAIAFVRKIDRLPLPVQSSPGFLVNRILMPYLLESMVLLNEGIPATVIDKAMTTFGMPMGPITLADTVGLDVCLSVAKYLGDYFNMPIPPKLVELVAQRKLGRKTGIGFYQYDSNGKQIKPDASSYDKPLQAISDRLVLCMLNEAFACLREGVVTSGDLVDAGMIFGTGFAPFRGGPIHYAKSQGIEALYQQFLLQQQSRGAKMTSNQSWDTITA